MTTALIVSLVAAFGGPFSKADDPPGPVVPEKTAEVVEPSLETIPGDVVYLPDGEGRLVPVPRGASLEAYLRFLEERRRTVEGRSSVVRVDLVGSADDKVATLTATIQVKASGEGWVRVPLGLDEAVLRDFEYRFVEGTVGKGVDEATKNDSAKPTTPGEANFEGFAAETGYTWRFRGAGLHELVLELLVPIRFQSPTRRLQLDLPETAVSSLRLDVPGQPIAVTPPRNAQWNVRSEGTDRSRIEMFGLGRRLELSWEPRPRTKKSETTLESITLVDVRPNDRTVVLEATQRVQVVRGTIDSLRIRPPTDFEVRNLTARLLDDPLNETIRLELPMPDDEGWAEIPLPASLVERARIELEWTLESAVPWSDRPLTVDGFEIGSAVSQSGELAIEGLTGHDVVVRRARNAHRIDVSELAGSSPAISAFRFLRQPFEIRLEVAEIEPHFTVQPKFDLHVERNALQLVGSMQIRIDRGALRELTLAWPNYAEQGWVLSPPNVPGLVEQFEIVGSGVDSELRFQLLSAATGELVLPIRARRTVLGGDSVPLALPTMPAPYRLPTILQVTREIDVEPRLTAAEGTSVRRESSPLRPPMDEESFVTTLRVEPGPHEFELTATPRERSVTARAEIEPELVAGDLVVRERLVLDVDYGHVDELRFEAAGELPVVVDDGGERLAPEWVDDDGSESADRRTARVALGKRRTGRFALTVLHDVRRAALTTGEETATTKVDLLVPIDVDEWSARFVSRPEGGLDVRPAGEDWEMVGSVGREHRWRSSSPPSTLTLEVLRSDDEPIVVRRALVRTAVDSFGATRTWTRFEIEGAEGLVVVVLPDGAAADEFSWNGRELDGANVLRPTNGSRRYLLDLGTNTSGSGLLLVRTHAEAGPLGLRRLVNFAAPELPAARWIEQTVWELSLPVDQYLFTPPTDFSPNYSWKQSPIFWKRVPRAAFADPTTWIDDAETDDERAEFEARNRYQFTRFGPAGDLEIRLASRGYVLLFGAGTALALGFVMLKVSAVRSVLAVLGVGFVLAGLSLWFPEPVLLLLQPALLGLLLALAAAFIDGLVVRRRSSPILSFPTPLDFSSLGAEGSSQSRPLVEFGEDTGSYAQPSSSRGGASS